MDSPAPAASETTGEMLKAMIEHFPALNSLLIQETPKTEQARVDVQRDISPQVAQIQTDLLTDFGPGLARAGAGFEEAGAQGRAEGEARILGSVGPELAQASRAIMQMLDPEFMRVREGVATGFDNLGLDQGAALTGGELEQVARGQNRTAAGRGLAGTPTNTSAVESAVNFGDAITRKKLAISQALQGFQQALPALRTGVDPAQLALGRASTGAQLAAGAFPGISQPNVGASTQQLAGGLLSETGANARQANQINANRRTALDVGMGVFGGVGDFLGGIIPG